MKWNCCRTCDPAGLGVWTALAVAILAASGLLSGCSSNDDDADLADVVPAGGGDVIPQFSLAWSEYPSWSAFGVAEEEGLLDGDAGALGEMEKKWGVDVVLKQADYDPCLTLYADGQVDAVCITNIDLLPLAPGRKSTVVLPTSTSDGGDACLAVGISDVAELKRKETETRGLAKSVSQYVFERCLEERGENPADYRFADMDPAQAALGMQNGDLESIVVWNPFALSTERNAKGAARLFDSSEIPGEVIDLVAVANASLAKPGGDAFAGCLADTFHTFNERLAGPDRDELLVALGEKFSNLGLEDMKTVVTQTKFYSTADEARALLEDSAFRETVMPRVSKFVVDVELADEAPAVSFGGGDADVTFTTEYLGAEPGA